MKNLIEKPFSHVAKIPKIKRTTMKRLLAADSATTGTDATPGCDETLVQNTIFHKLPCQHLTPTVRTFESQRFYFEFDSITIK